jgi:hypothetical protein
VAKVLERRVARLETSGGRRCPECGWDPKSPPRMEVSVNLDGGGPDREIWCGTCGRPIHIIVTWGDAPD